MKKKAYMVSALFLGATIIFSTGCEPKPPTPPPQKITTKQTPDVFSSFISAKNDFDKKVNHSYEDLETYRKKLFSFRAEAAKQKNFDKDNYNKLEEEIDITTGRLLKSKLNQAIQSSDLQNTTVYNEINSWMPLSNSGKENKKELLQDVDTTIGRLLKSKLDQAIQSPNIQNVTVHNEINSWLPMTDGGEAKKKELLNNIPKILKLYTVLYGNTEDYETLEAVHSMICNNYLQEDRDKEIFELELKKFVRAAISKRKKNWHHTYANYDELHKLCTQINKFDILNGTPEYNFANRFDSWMKGPHKLHIKVEIKDISARYYGYRTESLQFYSTFNKDGKTERRDLVNANIREQMPQIGEFTTLWERDIDFKHYYNLHMNHTYIEPNAIGANELIHKKSNITIGGSSYLPSKGVDEWVVAFGDTTLKMRVSFEFRQYTIHEMWENL